MSKFAAMKANSKAAEAKAKPFSSPSSSTPSTGHSHSSTYSALVGNPMKRNWGLDDEGRVVVPEPKEAPLGYSIRTVDVSSDASSKKEDGKESKSDLVYNSAMALAQSPGSQLMMTAFMLWMSGNTLQIFSISMLAMAFWQPIQKIIGTNDTFAKYKDSKVDITLPKLVWIGINICAVFLALYKCQTMGLLPTAAELGPTPPVRPSVEFSAGGIQGS